MDFVWVGHQPKKDSTDRHSKNGILFIFDPNDTVTIPKPKKMVSVGTYYRKAFGRLELPLESADATPRV